MINYAWEVTDDDIELAMRELGLSGSADDWRDELDESAVITTVLSYVDFDEQCDVAHSEIVNQLREANKGNIV